MKELETRCFPKNYTKCILVMLKSSVKKHEFKSSKCSSIALLNE